MSLIKEYRSDMNSNELYLMNTETKTEAEFYEKMIAYNDIRGVLKFRSEIVDGRKKYLYKADGLKLLSVVTADKKPDLDMLKNILLGIIQVVEEAKEYLLSEQDFVLLPDCMFLDSANKLLLCCLPGYERGLKEQLTSLFEYLMNYLDYQDKDAVVVLYELYRRSKELVFTFEDIKSILDKKTGSAEEKRFIPAATEIRKTENKAPEFKPAEPRLPEPVKAKKSFFGSHKQNQSKEKQAPLPAMERTTLLFKSAEEADFVLKAEDGKEVIFLSKFPFYIGKGAENIDFNLQYPQISRMHAKITKDAEQLFLADMRSTNGCAVNGTKLNPGEPVRINTGDTVSLANRNYILEERH